MQARRLHYEINKEFIMKASRLILLVVVGFGLAIVSSSSIAGGKKSDSEVKVTATAKKADASGKQVVTVNLDINKGWHVYANPVGNETLEQAQTTVTVNSKTKPKEIKLLYPDGVLKKDATVGDYRIYKEKVQIQATVLRAGGDTGPLEVSVRFMACHDKGVCLLPATVKVKVP